MNLAYLLEAVDDVDLSDVAEVRVEYFNEEMDHLEICQLIVRSVHADRKEKTCISLVDNLIVPELCRAW